MDITNVRLSDLEHGARDSDHVNDTEVVAPGRSSQPSPPILLRPTIIHPLDWFKQTKILTWATRNIRLKPFSYPTRHQGPVEIGLEYTPHFNQYAKSLYIAVEARDQPDQAALRVERILNARKPRQVILSSRKPRQQIPGPGLRYETPAPVPAMQMVMICWQRRGHNYVEAVPILNDCTRDAQIWKAIATSWEKVAPWWYWPLFSVQEVTEVKVGLPIRRHRYFEASSIKHPEFTKEQTGQQIQQREREMWILDCGYGSDEGGCLKTIPGFSNDLCYCESCDHAGKKTFYRNVDRKHELTTAFREPEKAVKGLLEGLLFTASGETLPLIRDFNEVHSDRDHAHWPAVGYLIICKPSLPETATGWAATITLLGMLLFIFWKVALTLSDHMREAGSLAVAMVGVVVGVAGTMLSLRASQGQRQQAVSKKRD